MADQLQKACRVEQLQHEMTEKHTRSPDTQVGAKQGKSGQNVKRNDLRS